MILAHFYRFHKFRTRPPRDTPVRENPNAIPDYSNEIRSSGDLDQLRNGWGHFHLMGDIRLEDNFVPIDGFSGILDGNGFRISMNLPYTRNLQRAGLFGTIDSGSTVEIRNLHIDIRSRIVAHRGRRINRIEFARSYAGAFVAFNRGNLTISQSFVTGQGHAISAENCSDGSGTDRYAYAGGMIGMNHGTVIIRNSYSLSGVRALVITRRGPTRTAYAGGLVGENRGSLDIINSFYRGNITAARCNEGHHVRVDNCCTTVGTHRMLGRGTFNSTDIYVNPSQISNPRWGVNYFLG